MKNLLIILSALDGGGVDRIIYNYSIRMLEQLNIDFVVFENGRIGILEKKLQKRGCRVFRVPPVSEDIRGHIREMQRIISSGNYDIVHSNLGYKSFIVLAIAKKYKVRYRIAHSHIAFIPESGLSKFIRKCMTLLTEKNATELYACGNDAANWTWGNRETHIMHNAIEAEKFSFSDTKRTNLRKSLGIEDRFVIGNVSRFSEQKNHFYLIDVFEAVHEKNSKAILLLIGNGGLETKVREYVETKNLKDSVYFLGVRDDVKELLNVMDCFVLPSLFEGLPVVLVEVQSNGLPAIISDTVTKEIQIASNLKYLSLNSSKDIWADAILQSERDFSTNPILNTNYDIDKEAAGQIERYLLF